MKKLLIIFALVFFVFCCKNEEKKISATSKKVPKETFESSLLDLRDVNKKFNDNYKVEKFGVLNNNSGEISFVFKLNDSTTNATVESYSLGLRAFDMTLEKPVLFTFGPIVKEIEGHKYIITRKVTNSIEYLDSLSAYIYKRNDWKGSGRIGGFKIYDILLEDKKNK